MKLIATTVLISTLALTSAWAQTPPAAAPATTPSAPATTPAPAEQTGMKEVRQQCRTQVRAQNLKGDERRNAMMQCLIQARPDRAAAIKCMFDPQVRTMDRDARRSFVKDCVAKAKG